MILDILYSWLPANMDLVYRNVRKYWGRRNVYAGAATALQIRYVAKPMTRNKHTYGTVQVKWKGSLFAYTKITARPWKGGANG